MEISLCYKIGYILKPHGLKGDVTISVDADAPDNLSAIKSIFIEKNNRLIPYFITSISVRGAKAFLTLDDVDTLEEAELISKHAIYLPKSERPKAARGEFYDDEVTDFEVVDENGVSLGNIKDVMKAGVNRLLVMDHFGKEVLIPINSPFIISVNKIKKKITVNLPEGFLDI